MAHPMNKHVRPVSFATARYLAKEHGTNVVRLLASIPKDDSLLSQFDEDQSAWLESTAVNQAVRAAHYALMSHRSMRF